MLEDSLAPRAFYAHGGPRRRYASGETQKSGSEGGESDRQVPESAEGARMAACPGAILDSAPGGGGLGVWLLVEEDEAEGTCTYEYGGGIA
jgi:hypothetical protein